MSWPFLYFADERLSHAELTAARLDGDLVEVGEAFMPTDAVETRELRAASVAPLIPATVALTRASAAWVHGALAAPPARHTVQRIARTRIQMWGPRLSYSDLALPPEDVTYVDSLAVATAARTVADLARDLCGGDHSARRVIDALLGWRPALAADGAAWLEGARPVHFKRPALAYLRARAAVPSRTS